MYNSVVKYSLVARHFVVTEDTLLETWILPLNEVPRTTHQKPTGLYKICASNIHHNQNGVEQENGFWFTTRGDIENEYQEHFLGVKAASAWGWQPHHLHVPNVMEMWEPKPPGTLWAAPGLLRDSFTFTRGDMFSSQSVDRIWGTPSPLTQGWPALGPQGMRLRSSFTWRVSVIQLDKHNRSTKHNVANLINNNKTRHCLQITAL